MFSDLLFLSRKAAHGYHHVNYFNSPKLPEHYDDFYGKALQVVDVNMLSIASHVKALLVDYIRDRLVQPRAAERFHEWWIGPRGRWSGWTHVLHKKTNRLRGTAGPRRAAAIAAMTKDKDNSVSKLSYLMDQPIAPKSPVKSGPAKFVILQPVSPSSASSKEL
jgi:hypothetical protein